jgi:predicted deacylase
MSKQIKINGQSIGLGKEVITRLNISTLPSGTVIDIPVHVFRAPTDGPVLLLMAGMHGDEVNGIEIVRRLVGQKLLKPQRGTVIAIPVLNIYGFLNFSREVPDGKDVNRSFPGSASGSLASRVAYTFVKEILPWIDYGLDFHTGGASRTNFPQVRCVLNDPENEKIASAFGAPFVVDSALLANSLRKEAAKHGKKIVVYESGESLRFDEKGIQIANDGALRVMNFLKIQPAILPEPQPAIICRKTNWIRAHQAGLFHSRVHPGEFINKDQIIGSIADPYGEKTIFVKSPYSGFIIGLNHMPVVNEGDALAHIGRE